MYAHTANLYRAMHQSLKDETFDDDCEIEGRLLFSHNGSESVLVLEEDMFYSSDFNRIIKLIDTLLDKKRACRDRKLFHFKWHRQYTGCN